MARKHKHDEAKPVNTAAWMTSFCDLLTLLLCFFVLLLTMRAMDDRKFEQAFGSFSGAFGVLAKNNDVGVTPALIPPMGTPVPEIVTKDIQAVLESTLRVAPRGRTAGDEGVPPEPRPYRHLFETEQTETTIETRIAGEALFVGDTAELRPGSQALLLEIGRDLALASSDIRVESYLPGGHGDEDAGWELSLDRAAVIAEALGEAPELDRARVSVMGYARQAPKLLTLDPNAPTVAIIARTHLTALPAKAPPTPAGGAVPAEPRAKVFDPYVPLAPNDSLTAPESKEK